MHAVRKTDNLHTAACACAAQMHEVRNPNRRQGRGFEEYQALTVTGANSIVS
jgi:hypothetical protein